MDNHKYDECLKALRKIIPDEEYERIMSQYGCELDHDFLGFVEVYRSLSELIPKDKIVIDFGCYLAAQSYFFAEHRQYIGVDVVKIQRFTPSNAKHYICSIQNFMKNTVPELLGARSNLEYCAICSYVPDFDATRLVRETFSNVFCYYPSGHEFALV